MRLGCIDYLNCYPFYFRMFEREAVDGVEVVSGYPSDLNRMMAAGELDLSPISSAACAAMNGQILLLPDFCLSSVGYVGSVVLRSKVPIEDLNGRTVGITRASDTSVLLLKMLLERSYGLEPLYRTTEPNPSLSDLDAALVIGNEAMLPPREPTSYSYDLGELWLRKTGYPVVFAVFAVRQKAVAQHRTTIRSVIESFRNSLACLHSEKNAVIAAAHRKYPQILYDIDAYYRLLRFEFTPELKEALLFYLSAAAEAGLISEMPEVQYLEDLTLIPGSSPGQALPSPIEGEGVLPPLAGGSQREG